MAITWNKIENTLSVNATKFKANEENFGCMRRSVIDMEMDKTKKPKENTEAFIHVGKDYTITLMFRHHVPYILLVMGTIGDCPKDKHTEAVKFGAEKIKEYMGNKELRVGFGARFRNTHADWWEIFREQLEGVGLTVENLNPNRWKVTLKA